MEKIIFNSTDNVVLDGFLSKCNSKTNKVIISVHGMSSNCLKIRDDIIAKVANENNIDYFCFNNRGSELVKYIRIKEKDKVIKKLGGTSYENVLDSYYDIKGAILKVIELGYKEIFLQGHSLGCTKIVYTYNKLIDNNEIELLNKIRGIILLSLIDIPRVTKIFLNKKYDSIVDYAEQKLLQGNENDLMPKEAFIHPISVKTFLGYTKYSSEIDFAKYFDESYNFDKINNINKPLFMRWGNCNELIEQTTDKLVEIVKRKIVNPNLDINYIDGADHGYSGKEELLANQIINFIKNIRM